jgi:hypothetical protein
LSVVFVACANSSQHTGSQRFTRFTKRDTRVGLGFAGPIVTIFIGFAFGVAFAAPTRTTVALVSFTTLAGITVRSSFAIIGRSTLAFPTFFALRTGVVGVTFVGGSDTKTIFADFGFSAAFARTALRFNTTTFFADFEILAGFLSRALRFNAESFVTNLRRGTGFALVALFGDTLARFAGFARRTRQFVGAGQLTELISTGPVF